MKRFGRQLKGVEYTKRTGAYGLVVEDGKIALIKVPQGYFLPGGGVEEGEIPEQALEREFSEELGWTVQITDRVGQAQQFYYSDFLKKHIVNTGHFFIAHRTGVIDRELEDDHILEWMDVASAAQKLFHSHQAWSVKEYMQGELKKIS